MLSVHFQEIGIMTPKKTSLQRFRLKKLLDTLSSKEGRGTELVSLYVPEGRQISEVLAMLKQERGTASNIKSEFRWILLRG